MLDLSLNYGLGAITLADISERQGISLSYLEQLFARLRKQGLVSSSRGPGGGYRLSRTAENITVLDVIAAVDEKVDTTQCEGKQNCRGEEQCLSHELWQSLSDQIRVYLSGITLDQVVRDYEKNRNGEQVIQFDTF
ncbi:MAG TPA: Rrf2 family transcriptional regulator [Methylophaga aminisulfidivorans]|nr:Rrf2 family transcriptional regulator [Methylophaga aminisulfidivorans]